MPNVNWLKLVIDCANEGASSTARPAIRNLLGEGAERALLKEAYDRRIWRICNLLKAWLNEHKGKPGDLGRNQGQIRVGAEGLHEQTLIRLKGNFEGLEGLIAQAERTKADRDKWIDAAIPPALQRQLELMVKMAA